MVPVRDPGGGKNDGEYYINVREPASLKTPTQANYFVASYIPIPQTELQNSDFSHFDYKLTVPKEAMTFHA